MTVTFVDGAPNVPLSPAQAIAPSSDKPDVKPKSGFDTMIGSIGAGADAASKKIQALDASTMKLTPPELKLPPKPEVQNTDPVEAWGSTAMVFAALASFAVRGHATAAMNAAAAAMKGIQARDKETTDQNFKVWETQSKNAIEMANFQQRAYQTILDSVSHKEDVAFRIGDAADRATEAKISAVAKALQDPAMTAALDHGGIEEAAKLQTQREKTAQDYKDRQLAVSAAYQKMLQRQAALVVTQGDEFKKAQADGDAVKMAEMLQPYTDNGEKTVQDAIAKRDKIAEDAKKEQDSAVGQAAKAYDEWLESPEGQAADFEAKQKMRTQIYSSTQTKGGRVYPDPDTLAPAERGYLKESLKSYDQQFPALPQQRGNLEGWQKLADEIKKENPEWDPAKFKVVQTARTNVSNGKLAGAISSYTRVLRHEDVLRKLIELRKSGADANAVRGLAGKLGQQIGDTNITSFETAAQLYGDEVAKAVVGTGASALGDRDKIASHLSYSLSDAQLIGNLDTIDKLIGGALVSTVTPLKNSGLPANEILNAMGLPLNVIKDRLGINPEEFLPTTTGPISAFGQKFDMTKDGLAPQEAPAASAAPAAAGGAKPPMKQDSTGQWWAFINGKKVKTDENGTPVQ